MCLKNASTSSQRENNKKRWWFHCLPKNWHWLRFNGQHLGEVLCFSFYPVPWGDMKNTLKQGQWETYKKRFSKTLCTKLRTSTKGWWIYWVKLLFIVKLSQQNFNFTISTRELTRHQLFSCVAKLWDLFSWIFRLIFRVKAIHKSIWHGPMEWLAFNGFYTSRKKCT